MPDLVLWDRSTGASAQLFSTAISLARDPFGGSDISMQHDSDDYAAIERAWELFLQGDVEGALRLTQASLEANSGSPDALNLMGTLLVSRGELEEALSFFEKAVQADDFFVEARVNAGDVLMQMAHPEMALVRFEEAAELAAAPDLKVEIFLAMIDALLSMGRGEEAATILGALPDGPFDTPLTEFLIGRAAVQLGDFARGLPLLEQSLAVGVEDPDLHYYLGLAREGSGDLQGSIVAFLQCLEFDRRGPRPPWSESTESFEMRVQGRIRSLRPDLSAALEGALVLVEPLPGIEMVAEGLDPRAPAMMDEIRLRDSQQTLRRLFIYQRNIDRFAPQEEMIDADLDRVLVTEIEAFLKAGPPPAE